MTDVFSKAKRSEIMALVRSKDTKPELLVRSLVFRMGYRFRLHRKDLPGKPDLVFPSRRRVIFVHGCFWHRHKGCPNCRMPKSKLDFWRPKLLGNVRKDRQVQQALKRLGWQFLVLWECELKRTDLERRIRTFMEEQV